MAQQCGGVDGLASHICGAVLRARLFCAPLVESTRSGPGGGGVVLTEVGRNVLSLYCGFEADAAEAGAARVEAMRALLRDIPERR